MFTNYYDLFPMINRSIFSCLNANIDFYIRHFYSSNALSNINRDLSIYSSINPLC